MSTINMVCLANYKSHDFTLYALQSEAHQAGDDEDHKGDAHKRRRLAQLLHDGEASRKLRASRSDEREHSQAAVDNLRARASKSHGAAKAHAATSASQGMPA